MRSKLFVPCSRPELFPKAMRSEADALSFDLEDAVQESRKEEARRCIEEFLRQEPEGGRGKLVIVRVNSMQTAHFAPDLRAVVWPALDAVNVPKLEGADEIVALAGALAMLEAERGIAHPIRILANIETPRALRLAAEIGRADPRVMGLQLGLGDLFESLGIDRSDTAAVHHLQVDLRLAAGDAGIPAYDGAFANVADREGFTAEAEAARRLGYAGKTCIHPSQVALANAVFRPSDAEIAYALRVLEATREAATKGVGAFMVDGRMIDEPFIKRATAIVETARQLGLIAV